MALVQYKGWFYQEEGTKVSIFTPEQARVRTARSVEEAKKIIDNATKSFANGRQRAMNAIRERAESCGVRVENGTGEYAVEWSKGGRTEKKYFRSEAELDRFVEQVLYKDKSITVEKFLIDGKLELP